MAKTATGNATKKRGKTDGSNIRIEVAGKDYDDLMEMAELEERSIRAQALYIVKQAIQQWRAAKGK